MASYSSRMLIAVRSRTADMFCRRTTTMASPNLFSQKTNVKRNYSIKSSSSLEPPDVSRLAQTARISLSPQEVEEFGPKIQQVVDWFGQLQSVDLESIEPAIRSDIDGDNLREDVPLEFENKEAIIASVPNYDEPYIKVPKVLNKE